MRIYMGFPAGDGFNKWLKTINRSRARITGIVTKDISCYEARETIERSRGLSPQHTWKVDGLKEALIHLIACDDQRCRQILLNLVSH